MKGVTNTCLRNKIVSKVQAKPTEDSCRTGHMQVKDVIFVIGFLQIRNGSSTMFGEYIGWVIHASLSSALHYTIR
jgi:hypothetical protein